MNLDNKKIFLAGATGMVGTSILKSILENYLKTKVYASWHNTEPFIKHSQIEYVRGDLKSVEDCRRMSKNCDCAIMAASQAGGVGFTRQFPWEHMKENLLMNIQMLEAFRLENIKRVIFIGSAVLYQEFEGGIKEDELDFNKEPHEAYFGFAWGMRFLEKLCQFLNLKYGMEVIIVRAANIFGPYDKFNPESSNFIPALIRKAVDKIDPFEVWGSPDVTRDVIYADDFGRAILMMADNDQIKFDVFNLGSGVKTTVGNVVEWALKYSGHHPSEIKYSQNKPTNIKSRALNCEKIKKILGWMPRYTIEKGVEETVKWWKENKDIWKR
jgi:GDP-L-fucose synthase